MNCYVPVPVKDKEKQMLMIFVRLLIVLSSLFPECNVWSSLEQNYNLLKSMLSQKYGVPTEVVFLKLTMISYLSCLWIDVLGTPCMRLRKAILNCLYRKGIMENILFR